MDGHATPTTATGILLALLLTACASRDPIRIGVVLGADGSEGARLAAESVNAAGGINGRRLELVTLEGNYGTSARAALTAADRLTRDLSIVAVVGHANSSGSLAAAQLYNAAGMVQIAPTSSAPLFSSAGQYSFRMVPSDDHQAPFLVRELLQSRKVPRAAILYVNDDYGRARREKVTAALALAHAAPVYEGAYVENEGFADLPGLTRALEHARAGTIVWLGRGLELRRVLEHVRPRLRDVEVFASDGIGSSCCTRDALPVLHGVRYTRMLDPTDRSPSLARVDLVITDLRMPGEMDGFALLRWLRTERPALAATALMMSGDLHGDDLKEQGIDPDRLIKKPFERLDYLDRVVRLLAASATSA